MKRRKTERRKTQKSNFTLLELLVVLFLLGFISSLVGFRVHKAVEQYSFEKGAKEIFALLSYGHQIALSQQRDCEVSFCQKKGRLLCRLSSEEDPSLFPQKRWGKKFPGFFLYCNGKLTSKRKIEFSATGRVFPEEKICIKKGKHFFAKRLSNGDPVEQKNKKDL